MRRLAPLVLCVCAACGSDEAPTPEPATGVDAPAARPREASSATDAPAIPKGPGPVGTYTIDLEAQAAAVSKVRSRIADEQERRIRALTPEQREQSARYADAATALLTEALDRLAKYELTVEVREDGTARTRERGLGKDTDTALRWTEEGGLLVLSRTGVPAASDRTMRFRRDGDVLTWESDKDPGHARVPVTLRRR